jgi:hypothetical protein
VREFDGSFVGELMNKEDYLKVVRCILVGKGENLRKSEGNLRKFLENVENSTKTSRNPKKIEQIPSKSTFIH